MFDLTARLLDHSHTWNNIKKHVSVLCVSIPVKGSNPSNEELDTLSTRLGNNWMSLGRRLGFDDSSITAFDNENGRLFDKAYRMLMSWKEREGSDATYQVLYDALSHHLVNCRQLAEEFCCN